MQVVAKMVVESAWLLVMTRPVSPRLEAAERQEFIARVSSVDPLPVAPYDLTLSVLAKVVGTDHFMILVAIPKRGNAIAIRMKSNFIQVRYEKKTGAAFAIQTGLIDRTFQETVNLLGIL